MRPYSDRFSETAELWLAVCLPPVIGSTQDTIIFFTQYRAQCPDNDQERFVVACLKVKARIQSVVEVSPTQAIAASLCDRALPIDIRTATRHDDIAGSRHLHRRR